MRPDRCTFCRGAIAKKFLLTLVFMIALLPVSVAWARDYEIDEVNIDATVAQDGTLSVFETRTFDFSGSFSGVYWEIPEGSYQGNTIDVDIASVGIMQDGERHPFTESDSDQDGTYSITGDGSIAKVKLYSSQEDSKVTFYVEYTATNITQRWADTGELYWKFVSDGWDVPSQNVTCTIHLPVPQGESVTGGQNVRAWGHGNLEGNVSFAGNDVVFTVPNVETYEFAEARIVFPAEWLSSMSPSSESRLDIILSEEQAAAQEAENLRMKYRRIQYVTRGIDAALVIATLAYGIFAFRRYKKRHKPVFDDKYFRDVPSADHPALLAALFNDGEPTGNGFTASLMHLCDQHAIDIEEKEVFKTKRSKRKKKEYCLIGQRPPTDSGSEGSMEHEAYLIDKATWDFAFGVVGKRSKEAGERKQKALRMSDFDRFSSNNPESYAEGYESWMDAVRNAGYSRNFYAEDRGTGSVLLIALGIACIAWAIIVLFYYVMSDSILLSDVVCCFSTAGIGALALFISRKLQPMSQEAVELKAKLKALRSWLKDFTRLEEAWPQDVVLWNKLLVMAVALGVADEVIDQLKIIDPELVDTLNDEYPHIYLWYSTGLVSASSSLTRFDGFEKSAHQSMAASSNFGGGGGGFSVGGGGGAGGGGGGGAF
ncbi:MAG: DUF2207 domain-containing protein [Atopobiaceae bacterium]|jgi:uncharacterized membrane protein